MACLIVVASACERGGSTLMTTPGCSLGLSTLPVGSVSPLGCQMCGADGGQGEWAPQPDGAICDGGICFQGQCENGCWIDGGFVAAGLVGPSCLGCVPDASTVAETPFAVGTPCMGVYGGPGVCFTDTGLEPLSCSCQDQHGLYSDGVCGYIDPYTGLPYGYSLTCCGGRCEDAGQGYSRCCYTGTVLPCFWDIDCCDDGRCVDIVDVHDGGRCSWDSGSEVGPDGGVLPKDCTRHCVIDGGVYCANETEGGHLSCYACLPQWSSTSWTLLPVNASCSSAQAPARGVCLWHPDPDQTLYCECIWGDAGCTRDQQCCIGSCDANGNCPNQPADGGF